MKKTISLFALSAAALGIALTAAAAQEPLKVGFGAEPYPPFTEASASGEWAGFEIDIANALCEQMQVTCEPAPIAWDGIIPALTSGQIDMILGSMSITEERKQTVNFSDRYYYTASDFVAAKGSGIDVSPEGMQGKILGVQTGTTNADYAQKAYPDGVEIKLYNTQDEVNADLVAGRIDVMLADQIAMDAFVKSEAGAGMEVALLRNVSGKIEYNFVYLPEHQFRFVYHGADSFIDHYVHLFKAGINVRFGGDHVAAR